MLESRLRACVGGRRCAFKRWKLWAEARHSVLRAMVDLVGQEPSLSDVRLLVVCLVAFAGFMQCDELLKLQCSDIAFGTENMTINITSSKTDQYRYMYGSSLVVDRYRDTYIPGSHDGEIFQHGWFVYTRAWQSVLGKRWAVIE